MARSESRGHLATSHLASSPLVRRDSRLILLLYREASLSLLLQRDLCALLTLLLQEAVDLGLMELVQELLDVGSVSSLSPVLLLTFAKEALDLLSPELVHVSVRAVSGTIWLADVQQAVSARGYQDGVVSADDFVDGVGWNSEGVGVQCRLDVLLEIASASLGHGSEHQIAPVEVSEVAQCTHHRLSRLRVELLTEFVKFVADNHSWDLERLYDLVLHIFAPIELCLVLGLND